MPQNIKLAITGCMGRMGQQLIKSAKNDTSISIVSLTENRIIKKKISGIKLALNTSEAFKKAKEIQQNAQKLQDELESMEIEGKSDDEMIKVWISGNQLPLRVEVNEKITSANKEEIEKNILEAIKKAHESSTTTMKERMNDLTGGLNLNLPGLENNDS